MKTKNSSNENEVGIKATIRKFWSKVGDAVEYRLRLLVGRPSPMKRFLIILCMGVILTIANLYIIADSIYKMGKRDAEIKFMELQHIESLELQQKQDSINILNHKQYEYEQSR
jgi:hypothetical protein